MEIGILPEKEFKIMVVKMIQDLGKRMKAKIMKMLIMFTKDLEKLKKQTEINNTLEGINSRITEAEQINDLEDRMVELTATEQNIKRMKRNEDSLRDLLEKLNTSILT